jgi:hypothetical protein
MKMHLTLLSSNLLLFSLGTCAYAVQPKTYISATLGFVVNTLGQFMVEARRMHWVATKHVLR